MSAAVGAVVLARGRTPAEDAFARVRGGGAPAHAAGSAPARRRRDRGAPGSGWSPPSRPPLVEEATGPAHAVPQTAAGRIAVLRASDRSLVMEADDDAPRPLPDGDPSTVARAVALASLEVLAGRRSVAQLARWLTPGVYESLQVRAGLTQRVLGTSGGTRPPVIRRTRAVPRRRARARGEPRGRRRRARAGRRAPARGAPRRLAGDRARDRLSPDARKPAPGARGGLPCVSALALLLGGLATRLAVGLAVGGGRAGAGVLAAGVAARHHTAVAVHRRGAVLQRRALLGTVDALGHELARRRAVGDRPRQRRLRARAGGRRDGGVGGHRGGVGLLRPGPPGCTGTRPSPP